MFPAVLFLLVCCGSLFAQTLPENRYNVVLICVDDLRPELGCYGADHVISPNIDQLAEQGLRFQQHYVMVPSCGASRYAMLTGRRPSVSGGRGHGSCHKGESALDLQPHPGAQTMPELFRRNGYATACFGKVSHNGNGLFSEENKEVRAEVPHAWDKLPTAYGSLKSYVGAVDGTPLLQFPDCTDEDLPDGKMAQACIEQLSRYAADQQRFFIAVGFHKPHLPFVAPEKYRRLYDEVEVPLAPNSTRGDTAYWHPSDEFYKQYNIPWERPFSQQTATELRKAYMACVTYTDTQIGKVLRALNDLQLAGNTIVLLWGDHGWLLGDHDIWGKHTVLEQGVNSPLIIAVPGMKHAGQATDAIVESVDIYPTLTELCNLSFRKTRFPFDGYSLLPVLDHPEHPGKVAAISYYRSHTKGYNEMRGLRTSRYRLAVHLKKGSPDPELVELYDLQEDPLETRNIAKARPELTARLLDMLKKDHPIID